MYIAEFLVTLKTANKNDSPDLLALIEYSTKQIQSIRLYEPHELVNASLYMHKLHLLEN